MSKPTKHEKQRIGQLDAVLKHLDQLRTDISQLINTLQRERDLSRASRTIRSRKKARNHIRSPPQRETSHKR
jgi:DNA repair ATPase RecN